jgi:hypothetical protein
MTTSANKRNWLRPVRNSNSTGTGEHGRTSYFNSRPSSDSLANAPVRTVQRTSLKVRDGGERLFGVVGEAHGGAGLGAREQAFHATVPAHQWKESSVHLRFAPANSSRNGGLRWRSYRTRNHPLSGARGLSSTLLDMAFLPEAARITLIGIDKPFDIANIREKMSF